MTRPDPRPILLALTLLVGCGGEGGNAAEAAAGRPTAVVRAEGRVPDRIVSLLPAATEILVELGGGDRIVARAEGDPLLQDRETLPSLGSNLDPSLEVLTSVSAELIVAWTGSRRGALERTLAAGGAVVLLDIQGMDDLTAAIDTLGALLGTPERAHALNNRITADVRTAAAVGSPDREADDTGTSPRPSVAWIVWPDPLTLAGPGSFPDEVIRLAGGENVVGTNEGPWPSVGLETLVHRDPRILVWPEGGGIPGPESVGAAWRRVPALERGRVLRVPADRVHVPGPGLAEMLPELARRFAALHGGGAP